MLRHVPLSSLFDVAVKPRLYNFINERQEKIKEGNLGPTQEFSVGKHKRRHT